jgi:hypothetical protein
MKDHAIYVASKIKQNLKTIFDGVDLRTWSNPAPEVSSVEMTRTIADRLYTYAYLCASGSPEHDAILAQFNANLERSGDSSIASRPAGREAHYAVRYTLDHYFHYAILPSQMALMVERARCVMERCIECEEKLSLSERECMYAFHRLMSGIRWDEREVEINLALY